MRTLIAACLAVAVIALPAGADELIRKGGEWQATVTGATPQPTTMTLCFAPATWEQALAQSAARAGPKCSKHDITRSGNVVTFDVQCDTMTMHGTATLAGDSAYTADMTMRMGAGADAKTVHVMTDSKWIGACKPGERVMGADPAGPK